MTEAVARPVPGTPCWVSLMACDLRASEEFYGELFGWRFRRGEDELGPHVRAYLDGLDVAGLGEIRKDHAFPAAWLPYLATDDADETSGLIRDCGGTVGVGPMDSGQGDRVAIAADSAGASFGLWQAAALPEQPAAGRPGTPVWNEIIVPEAMMVTSFYRAVFGYEVERLTASQSDYHTFMLAGRPVCGVRGVGGALPFDRGSMWVTYFAVSELAPALRMVDKLGGRVYSEPRESPYGSYARVCDPDGAPFALIEMLDPRDAVERPLRDR
ncbi:VOC family protein [Streptomyces durbertensis]|uniref:VOC family protein n=1 Tax=Streptomyces durbertensis TaxID=2448886 RepID=A0ABR6ELX9_9ACTN|nr:VOC family protein [Streptomyces durbertensis]MBB1245519.1 VOC family protein [Streptomyces durbertensis]